jgi:putative endonuclease
VPARTSRPRHSSELRAARWYRLRGYRILGANVWLGGYELDLVARRGRTLVFCEVKSRRQPSYGDPLELVTPEKARRIRRAAALWLAAYPDHAALAVRYDIVVERAGRLQHVPDAF